jgi:hypothetical protein
VTAEEERWILIVIEEGRKAVPVHDDEGAGLRALPRNPVTGRNTRSPKTPFGRPQRTPTLRRSSTSISR